MKTIIFCFSSLLISYAVNCQDPGGKPVTSGRIIYEDKAKLEIKLEGDAAQMAESLPKEQVSEKVLLFNPDCSLYQVNDIKKNDNIMDQGGDHMTVRMIISGGNDKTFNDLKNRKKTEQKEFMTRLFLIESDLGGSEWKLTENFRTILGYNCQEAVRKDKDKNISAWFTSSIPVSTGPAGYEGLPGLILKVDIDNGKRTLTATSIDPSFDNPGLIAKPKEGKKVTSEEYKKIVDEKMKEMGAEGGGEGNHVYIRIKN
jgi:GLPGLI family protein